MSETSGLTVSNVIFGEEPSAALRWNDGILEQGILVTRFEGGKPVDRYVDWRPVPSVSEPSPTQKGDHDGRPRDV